MVTSLMPSEFIGNPREFVSNKSERLTVLSVGRPSYVTNSLLNIAGDTGNVAFGSTDGGSQADHDDPSGGLSRSNLIKRLAQVLDVGIRYGGAKSPDVTRPFFQAVRDEFENLARCVVSAKAIRRSIENASNASPDAVGALGNEQAGKGFAGDLVRQLFGSGFLRECRGTLQLSAQRHDLNIETVHGETLSSVYENTTIAGLGKVASLSPEGRDW